MEYGLIGAVMILIAWIPQTLKDIKDRGKDESWLFMALYTAGTLLLLVHSMLIHDMPFTLLNGVILVISIINIGAKMLWQARK